MKQTTGLDLSTFYEVLIRALDDAQEYDSFLLNLTLFRVCLKLINSFSVAASLFHISRNRKSSPQFVTLFFLATTRQSNTGLIKIRNYALQIRSFVSETRRG